MTITNPDGGQVTRAGAFTVGGRPTLTSLSPSSRKQGLSNQTITLSGSGFVDGATVEFSGPGITVRKVTRVSSTRITLIISLSTRALVGARSVTVRNPDGGWSTLSDGIVVRPISRTA